jgi:hypothetical protein
MPGQIAASNQLQRPHRTSMRRKQSWLRRRDRSAWTGGSPAASQSHNGEPAVHVTVKAMSVEPRSGVGLVGPSGVRGVARDYGLGRQERPVWPADVRQRPEV